MIKKISKNKTNNMLYCLLILITLLLLTGCVVKAIGSGPAEANEGSNGSIETSDPNAGENGGSFEGTPADKSYEFDDALIENADTTIRGELNGGSGGDRILNEEGGLSPEAIEQIKTILPDFDVSKYDVKCNDQVIDGIIVTVNYKISDPFDTVTTNAAVFLKIAGADNVHVETNAAYDQIAGLDEEKVLNAVKAFKSGDDYARAEAALNDEKYVEKTGTFYFDYLSGELRFTAVGWEESSIPGMESYGRIRTSATIYDETIDTIER